MPSHNNQQLYPQKTLQKHTHRTGPTQIPGLRRRSHDRFGRLPNSRLRRSRSLSKRNRCLPRTVAETLRRAKAFFKEKTRDDILWVGPVQGGKHLDLVASSAVEMGKLPFQIHALGSPTEVMENYRYDVLADMILTAKKGLPIERPLHLFGAGHPSMFALAVSLGCDLFDSAAYALYARENRYMTENGTWRLNELDYFP